MKTQVTAIAGFILLISPLLVSQSVGAEYASPQGFRINYPDSWRIATKEQQEAVGEAAQRLVGSIDFSRVDVLIYDPQSDPTPSINVIASPSLVPTGQSGVEEVRNELQQGFSAAGVTVSNFDCQPMEVNGNHAISSTWVAKMGGRQVHQHQVAVNGKSHCFIVTCSSGAADADAETAFNQAINGFQITSEPNRTLGDWWDQLSPAVHNAAVGGAIGAGIALFSGLANVGRKRSEVP